MNTGNLVECTGVNSLPGWLHYRCTRVRCLREQADAWSRLWMRTTLTVPNDKGVSVCFYRFSKFIDRRVAVSFVLPLF